MAGKAETYITDLEYVEDPLTSKSPSVQMLRVCYEALTKIQDESQDLQDAVNMAVEARAMCEQILKDWDVQFDALRGGAS